MKGAAARFQAARIKAANARRLLENKAISPDELALSAAEEAEADAAEVAAKVEVERAQLVESIERRIAELDERLEAFSEAGPAGA